MITKFVIFSSLLILSVGMSLPAQQNQLLDEFILQEKAPFHISLYLVGVSSGIIREDQNHWDVVTNLGLRGFGDGPEDQIDNTSNQAHSLDPIPIRPITAGELGHALIQAFDIPAGFMYRLFPGNWYGAKEMEFRGFFPQTRRFNQALTPFEVVFAIQRAVNYRLARGFTPPDPVIGMTDVEFEQQQQAIRDRALGGLQQATQQTDAQRAGTGGVIEEEREVTID